MAAKVAKAAQRVAEELAKHEKEYLPWADVYDLDLLLKPKTSFYHKHVRDQPELSMKEIQEMRKETREELQNSLLSSFLGSYSENSKWSNNDDEWKDMTGWEEQVVFDEILELILQHGEAKMTRGAIFFHHHVRCLMRANTQCEDGGRQRAGAAFQRETEGDDKFLGGSTGRDF
eukprot:758429-Hanusia_phi.AAC.3